MTDGSTRRNGALKALSDDLAELVADAGRWVVAVNGRQRMSSTGIVWTPGMVVTAAHTLKRDADITLTFGDGRTATAALAGRDPGTDLALLRFEGDATGVAPSGTVSDLRVGNLALVVGRHGEGAPSAGLAVIGAVGDGYRTWKGGQIDRFIRLDAALYPGLSGAPVIDPDGSLIGLATAGIVRGAAVTIPASTIDRIARELATRGRVGRGFLGVAMQSVRLPASLLQSSGLSGEGGVIVLGIEPNGPAERAGLMLGDVIVSLGGERVQDPEDVLNVLAGQNVGGEVRAAVLRAGCLSELPITIGEWPSRRL